MLNNTRIGQPLDEEAVDLDSGCSAQHLDGENQSVNISFPYQQSLQACQRPEFDFHPLTNSQQRMRLKTKTAIHNLLDGINFMGRNSNRLTSAGHEVINPRSIQNVPSTFESPFEEYVARE